MKSTTLHPMEVAKRAGAGGGGDAGLTERVELLEDKMSGLEDYTIGTEIDTGKEWINGKRIYRQVVAGLSRLSTTESVMPSGLLPTNKDLITKLVRADVLMNNEGSFYGPVPTQIVVYSGGEYKWKSIDNWTTDVNVIVVYEYTKAE